MFCLLRAKLFPAEAAAAAAAIKDKFVKLTIDLSERLSERVVVFLAGCY